MNVKFGTRDKLTVAACCGIFTALCFPILSQQHAPTFTSDRIYIPDAPLVRYGQIVAAALAVLAISASLLPRSKNLTKPRMDIAGKAFLALISLSTLLALIQARIPSAVNGAVALIMIAGVSQAWSLNTKDRIKIYKYAYFSCLITIVFAFLLYGLPVHRYVGGINPNNFSQLSVILACSGLVLGRKYFLTGAAIAALSCILVDSRYGLVGVILASMAWIAQISRGKDKRLLVLMASLATCVVALSFTQLGDSIANLFHLNDTTRGLSSGLSGRSNQWAMFWPQLAEQPLFGYGFRNRAAYFGAHNGYLNTILENGIFLGPAIIVVFFIRLFKIALTSRQGNTDEQRHEIDLLTTVQFTLMVSAFFQPQLVNFGDVFGFFMLLVMTHGLPTYMGPVQAKQPSHPPIQQGSAAA